MLTQKFSRNIHGSFPFAIHTSRAALTSNLFANRSRYSTTSDEVERKRQSSSNDQQGISRDMIDEAESSASGAAISRTDGIDEDGIDNSLDKPRKLSTPTNQADIDALWTDILHQPQQINALRQPRPSNQRTPLNRDYLARFPASPRTSIRNSVNRMRSAESQAITRSMLEALSTTFRNVPVTPARAERSGSPNNGRSLQYYNPRGMGIGFGFGGAQQLNWSVGMMTSTPPWIRERRRREEESDPELMAQEEELVEEMNLVQTDAELVNWARRRIFTPLSTTQSSSTSSPKEDQDVSSSDSITPSSNPSDPITFPRTYPRMLAQIIRTARKSFRNPHLALAFFHHAQSHSLESYLSGCLTSAYNEYLATCWDSFRDLAAVDAGVREMSAAGVVWDKGTRDIVERVAKGVSEELEGRVGNGCGYRWGPNVYEVLSRLDGMAHRDMRNEQKKYERKMGEKRRYRNLLRNQNSEDRMSDTAEWV